MQYGLALSGGGFKGAIQVGAVEEILKVLPNGRFDFVSGISTGALIGALVSANKMKLLRALWESVRDSQGGVITNNKLAKIEEGKLSIDFQAALKQLTYGISALDIAKGVLSKKGKESIGKEILANGKNIKSLLDNSPLAQLLNTNIKLSDYTDTEFAFGTTSLRTGLRSKLITKDFYDDLNLNRGILASSTMPGIWESVPQIKTKYGTLFDSVDGGLTKISPISMIFELANPLEPLTIFIIHCNSQVMEPDMRERNFVNDAGRSLDILLHTIFTRDIDETLYRNDNAEKLGLIKADLVIIEPKAGDSGGTLDARPETINYRFELGKALAKQSIKQWQQNS